MGGVIVDLDRSVAVSRRRSDRYLIAALGLACVTFGLAVALRGPDASAPVPSGVDAAMMTPTERLALVTRDDAMPSGVLFFLPDVVLSAMPDRFLNEVGPAALREAVRVRGTLGIASVERPAVIMWTERGVTYWLTSATRTTDDLIRLADTWAP